MIRTCFGFTLLAMTCCTFSNAATISSFAVTTNDGVFTLSPLQATALGVPDADRIGFFRIREGGGTTFDPGDTFDSTTIINSLRNPGQASSLLGIFNGENSDLTYTGDFFEPLGETTVGTPNSYFRGVMFAFSSNSGNIVFGNTTTFNGGQTQGPSALPVPEPSTFVMAGIGIVGLVALRRKMKKN